MTALRKISQIAINKSDPIIQIYSSYDTSKSAAEDMQNIHDYFQPMFDELEKEIEDYDKNTCHKKDKQE